LRLQQNKGTDVASSLFTLLDDIASVLDDVAVMTKVATKKTVGVLGDDLALNAEQVAGVNADRELPVVWAVAKGSARNKAILVPAALAISFLAPWGVVPLLMIGGMYLCFEGIEKLLHKFLHKEEEAAHKAEHLAILTNPAVDPVALEQEKIKGAIRTDFVLSAEIIVIALGTAAGGTFGKQAAVLVGISILMTVGVYGLVGGIVKLDDAGFYLSKKPGSAPRALGQSLLRAAPLLMKFLSVAGTVAMFMVGGGILTHGLPGAHDIIHSIAHATGSVPVIGGLLEAITPSILDALAGVLAGAIALLIVSVAKRAIPTGAAKDPHKPAKASPKPTKTAPKPAKASSKPARASQKPTKKKKKKRR
jgi:uncharacterized protein